ncbi:DUF4326 domain-containing protein [Acanthamoeba castellanii medusavirus]|uniref:DUF4326 domain-containing protein n=1 Tax=Acanthamoeba castellanii medusavirus J1 TaxID=3114988 RepID=A0A3T1CXA9_9VIRU|nr:DUF4326 domain-containing protein [Acanthamoeba castellanii medusavirus]BBI30470.1 DUF4326 domain-containing protein [Acanthamoeba castellanii medusavirus J1]
MDNFLVKRERDAGAEQHAAKKTRYELPKVVRITHANKDDPNLVYIGREWNKGGYDLKESKWHNPFFLKKDATPAERQKCLDEFRSHITSKYGCGKYLMRALPELAGKTLGCWCAPLPCHGDVLVDLLRNYQPPPVKPPYFRVVEGNTSRIRFRVKVDFETIGKAEPFDPANPMHSEVLDEAELENYVANDILNVDWQFAPFNPTFSWNYPDLDVECDLPPTPEGAKKMEDNIKMLKFMSLEKGAYMADMKRTRDGKVIAVEIHVVGKRL